jgi:hypothetical protein
MATAPAPVPGLPEGPTDDDIRYVAYLQYLERGAVDGHDLDDWLYAERELKKDR